MISEHVDIIYEVVREPIVSSHLTSLFQCRVVLGLLLGLCYWRCTISSALFSFYTFQCKTIGTVTSSYNLCVLAAVISKLVEPTELGFVKKP